MRLLAPLLACALFACAPQAPLSTEAQSPPPNCRPWSVVRTWIPADVEVIEAPDVASFLDHFNAVPPPSHVRAEQAFIIHQGNDAAVFFVTAGCVVARASMDWETLSPILGTAS